MRLSNTVLLASLNRYKFEEFQFILSAYPQIELHLIQEFVRNAEDLEFVEKYSTYLENACAKARMGNQASHYPTLADDSGLEVQALNGKPGVRSHRYAPTQAKLTQDEANLKLLLSELKNTKDRSARFVCTVALVIEGVLLHATGVLEGTIADSPRGTGGFGYDPIFIPQGETRSLAELSSSEKNAISHRSKAIHELIKLTQTHDIVFAKP